MDKKQTSNGARQGTGREDIWLTRATSDAAKRAYFNTPTTPATGKAISQRGSIRKPISCTLLVRAGSSYLIARKVHDISLAGAFVEMDTTNMATGDFVEVTIEFVYNQRQVEHTLAAEVMRIEPAGVGLKFGAYGNRTYTDLVNLLYTS
jgi:hypothetical protein